MEKVKFCKDCGEERPVSEFGRDIRGKDGYARYCRKHANIRKTLSHRKHPEPHRRAARNWWRRQQEKKRINEGNLTVSEKAVKIFG